MNGVLVIGVADGVIAVGAILGTGFFAKPVKNALPPVETPAAIT